MKKNHLFFFLIIPVFLIAQVNIRDTVITWHTFDYELNEDYTVSWFSDIEYDTVQKTFSGVILENKYLKVTLVPEFGGRILSMIYKPTGKEQLYQNPAGTPYGVDQDWFYYKWLMVYGGIFPTLTEPEHGKAWFLPWEFSLLKESTDTVSLQMSWQDTVALEGINSGKWKYGKTNLKCNYIVTLVKGSSSLETSITLINDSNEDLDYEYWTCLTLAPGSIPGNPKCTEGAELIIPASKVKIPAWYPDIANQEERIPGESGVYTFTNLRYWRNWSNDGIAYPWDDTDENYWGVINHDDEEGIIRVSDNQITPGIKIWAWGYEQSQNIDPFKDPEVTRRPYIELWAGHSNEFFEPAGIEMNSMKEWKEIYFPTVGLSNVTNANNEIVADFYLLDEREIYLEFVTGYPGKNYDVNIEITGQSPEILFNQTVLPDPVDGNLIKVNLPENQTWSGQDTLKCVISNSENGNYLTAAIPLDTIFTDVSDYQAAGIKDFQLYQNYPNPFNPVTNIKYTIPVSDMVSLRVYNTIGEEIKVLVNKSQSAGSYEIEFNAEELTSGVYFYKLTTSNYSAIKKMIILK